MSSTTRCDDDPPALSRQVAPPTTRWSPGQSLAEVEYPSWRTLSESRVGGSCRACQVVLRTTFNATTCTWNMALTFAETNTRGIASFSFATPPLFQLRLEASRLVSHARLPTSSYTGPETPVPRTRQTFSILVRTLGLPLHFQRPV